MRGMRVRLGDLEKRLLLAWGIWVGQGELVYRSVDSGVGD